MKKIEIVGGGFSGAALAVYLLDGGSTNLDIQIFEPRQALGREIAYGDAHATQILNVPAARVAYAPGIPTTSSTGRACTAPVSAGPWPEPPIRTATFRDSSLAAMWKRHWPPRSFACTGSGLERQLHGDDRLRHPRRAALPLQRPGYRARGGHPAVRCRGHRIRLQ